MFENKSMTEKTGQVKTTVPTGKVEDGKTVVAETAKDEAAIKAARAASAKKMLDHKKAALKTIVDYAKRMNADGKDAAVKEAVEYLSGESRGASGANNLDLIDKIFATSKTVKALDIFMNFEKGKVEMAALMKKAAAKGITITYDEKTKSYTKA